MIPALFALLLVAEEPQQAAQAPAASTEAQSTKSEKKICKTENSGTGSRMRKKMCLTQTEWDLRAEGKSAADLKTIGAR